jgi:hypothetical protein
MDRIVGLKNIDLNLNVSQVLETLIKKASRTEDKVSLTIFIESLAKRELEAYKTETYLRVKIMKCAAQFYERRVQEYRETLKKAKFLAFLRKMEIEREAVAYASRETKAFVDILSGKEKRELLRGSREAIQHATDELIKLLRSGSSDFDISQLAGKLKYAIR